MARRHGLGSDWAARAAAIGRARFADPNDLALFRIDRPEAMDDLVRRFEATAISRAINPRAWEAGCALRDKRRFQARCVAAGLPVPPPVAETGPGGVRVHALPEAWPIVVKPAGEQGGAGVTLWAPEGAPPATEAALAAALAARFGARRDWLAQARLVNHDALRPLALDALATARITTLLDEAGAPEIVTTALRFPGGPGTPVDNIKAGGLMAPIDPETGALGQGCRGRGLGDFDLHPVTGARIAGLVLPDWAAAAALVRRAHAAAFADYALVGWDVALTPSGPVLIEGNGKPCMIVAQRAPRRGAGATRYGALLAHHLARAG